MFAALGSAQAIDSTKVVVTVNGEKVLAGEYYRRMEYLQLNRNLGPTVGDLPPGFLTLEQLITERLTLQLAKQKGCFPSDAELNAEYTQATTDNPELEKQWLYSGRTKEELFQQMRFEMTEFKLRTFGITITDLEVEDFYKKNPTMFTIPKRAKLGMIACADATARQKADADLAAGKKFGDVAKQYSEDFTKSNGGDVGWQDFDSITPSVRDVLKPTMVGKTTAWLPIGKTYVKFFLEALKEQELRPFDANLKRQLRRRLMLDRGVNKNDVAKEMKDFRLKATIEIVNPIFSDLYKRWLQSLAGG